MFNLITDRTASDVERVKELAIKNIMGMTQEEFSEWLSNLKGAYNATDFNRVENAVIYLIERLKLAGWYISLDTKTDWTSTDFTTPAQVQRYLDNVRALRACLPTGIPALDFNDMDRFNYAKANLIEQILVDIDLAITNIMQNYFYSSEIYAGEV